MSAGHKNHIPCQRCKRLIKSSSLRACGHLYVCYRCSIKQSTVIKWLEYGEPQNVRLNISFTLTPTQREILDKKVLEKYGVPRPGRYVKDLVIKDLIDYLGKDIWHPKIPEPSIIKKRGFL